MSLLIDLIEPAEFIIIWLTLFNWFSKQHIALVCGATQLLVVLANIMISFVSNEVLKYRFLGGGILWLILSCFDWKYFKFYPLEAGIFIDSAGRNRDDMLLFY